MSSISATLRKKPNKQGLFPLAVRITKNRKSTFLFIGQYIEEKFWDAQNKRVKKSHSNSVRLNNLIAKKISEANDTLLEVVAENKKARAADVPEECLSCFVNEGTTRNDCGCTGR